MKYIIILLLFTSSCSAQTGMFKTVNGAKVELTKAEAKEINAERSAERLKRSLDSIADTKKRLTVSQLYQLYDTLVFGRDVRNLTAAQQKIALGLLLFKNDMVATDFKMK